MATPKDSPSSHPRPAKQPDREITCGGCGTKYIAKSSGCPNCGGTGGKRGDEMIKKVENDSDLFK